VVSVPSDLDIGFPVTVSADIPFRVGVRPVRMI